MKWEFFMAPVVVGQRPQIIDEGEGLRRCILEPIKEDRPRLLIYLGPSDGRFQRIESVFGRKGRVRPLTELFIGWGLEEDSTGWCPYRRHISLKWGVPTIHFPVSIDCKITKERPRADRH